MADPWYYVKDGLSFGPFAFEQLEQLAASGLLRPVDMVRAGMESTWASAGTVPGLSFPGEPIASPPMVASPEPQPDPAVASAPTPAEPAVARPTRSRLLAGAMWGGFAGWLLDQFVTGPPPVRGTLVNLGVAVGGLALIVLAAYALITGRTVNFDGKLLHRPRAFRILGAVVMAMALATFLSGIKGLAVMLGDDRSASGLASAGSGPLPPAPLPGANGEFVSFGNGEEVYYRSGLRPEAERLGKALQAIQYFDGHSPKAVHLARSGDVWEIRMYLITAACTSTFSRAVFRDCLGVLLAGRTFPAEPIDLLLCDERLAERARFRIGPCGHVAVRPGVELYYSVPIQAEAERLAESMRGVFSGQVEVEPILSRREDSWCLTNWRRGEALTPAQEDTLRALAQDCSREVFGGEPFKIEILDFATQSTRSLTSWDQGGSPGTAGSPAAQGDQ